jgi:hypothetical protein
MFKKLIIPLLVNEFPLFTEYECLLACLQNLVSGPYPEPDEFSSHTRTPLQFTN